MDSRTYFYPYARVFETAKVILQKWNFTIVKANAKEYAIPGSGRTQAYSSGSWIGLYFSPLKPKETLVETIERKKIRTHSATRFYSSIILNGIEKKLKLEDKNY
jgi:hypothetical protein